MASSKKNQSPKRPADSTLVTVSKSLLAGGIAGAVAKSTIAPFDRVKILFQVDPTRPFSLRAALFEGQAIVRQEGFRALWKGNSATLVRILPYAGIQYASFDQYQRFFLSLRGTETMTPMDRLFAGSMAGATSVSITYPLDVMRARLAVQRKGSGVYRNLSQAFSHVVTVEGVWALSAGLGPTMVGILPYAGLSFATFETLKPMAAARSGNEELLWYHRMACGALAGLFAQSATYPLDVVRRRMQTDGFVTSSPMPPRRFRMRGKRMHGGVRTALPVSPSSARPPVPPRQYDGMWDTFKKVYALEGRRGLFKGLSMNWFKGPIAVSISFTAFDFMKRLFGIQRPGSSAL